LSEAPSDGAAAEGLRRFLFESHPLRGFWLRLEDSWSAALEHQSYAPEVRRLVGEAMAATALLAASLKFEGTLALQINGNGPVRLLVAQATHGLALRAVARLEDAAETAGKDFRGLVGEAQLTVTLEGEDRGSSWQGIVPLTGDSLAHSLEAYFATSEQIPTRVLLAADDKRVGGLLLQKLPAPPKSGEAAEGLERELWDEAGLLLQTVRAPELLATDPDRLLSQVFAGHDLRLFETQPVRFQCRCSRQRVASLLRSLGEAEVRDVLAEQGAVTITCEFCQRPYTFDAVDVEELFVAPLGSGAPPSLN
jgi:molecular chaperone Hsp33